MYVLTFEGKITFVYIFQKCLTGNRRTNNFHKEEQRIMEYIEDSSESEDLESNEWFIKKPFDPDDFSEVMIALRL